MKSTLLLLTLALFSGCAFAQKERNTHKSAAERFETYYNAQQADSIFAMFSREMQNALPLNKTRDFVAGLHAEVGKIKSRTFIKNQNSYAVYKANFELATLSLNISVDNENKINGLFTKPYEDESLPEIERNTTKLRLPFKDEWTVVWGGDTKELNYHVESRAQKNAFDLLITDSKGSTHKNDGQSNEDYYAFGKELYAPCDGKVVLVVDGVKENKIGEMNSFNVGGNTVIIKTPTNEYLVFCHLKHRSIKVIEGQAVKSGQLLGNCGNTGHSSEPHLHFHIQNVENMNDATGVKCYFDKLLVNGKSKSDYCPIQGEKIKPE